MKNIILVVLAVLSIGLLFGASQAVAASGEVVWKNTFDGGQIVIGEDKENQSIWIIKTDKNGTEQANYTFNGSGGNYGEPFQQTSDGGRITVNNVKRASYGDRCNTVRPCDIQLIKQDANRTEEWRKIFRKTLGGTPEDAHKVGKSVIQTSDGGYIVVGFKIDYGRSSTCSDFADLWVIKTDRNGTEEWDKTFSTFYANYGRLILQTSDGGYIIVGEEVKGRLRPDSPDNIWLIKINADGVKEWDKRFGSSGQLYLESIHQVDDGGYVIVSYATMYEYDLDNRIMKTDRNGTKEWEKIFEKPNLMSTPKPVLRSTPTPTPETAGFEAIFAIAGLLAIAYLLRQRK